MNNKLVALLVALSLRYHIITTPIYHFIIAVIVIHEVESHLQTTVP